MGAEKSYMTMTSKVVKDLLEYIEKGIPDGGTEPIHTLNSVGSHPLAYRTFGGQPQGNGSLNDEIMETAFGSHYLLTLLCSGAVIRRLLYREEESCHSLYCDGMTYQFFNSHGLVEHGVWDQIDYKMIDDNITMKNVDHRIYYSATKPFALLNEAKRVEGKKIPVLFVDADLILKKRHDVILKNATGVRAAYGHLEEVGTACYPKFEELHFPKGYRLPEELKLTLPAVNTCLMFFNDKRLMTEWSLFFAELFMNNWLSEEPDAATISKQLLGIDQRTFPMIAANHGYWGTDEIGAFLDLIWNPPCFYYNGTKRKAQWHYYTLEYHPEHPDWIQDITHTWINKRNIERDIMYRNYQGCMMLEIILELELGIEKYINTFESLKPYFELRRQYGTIENMLLFGAVRDKLDKKY